MATPAPLRPPLAPPPGIPVSGLKVSVSITGNNMPRIIPTAADENRTVELRLQIPGQPGRPGELLIARIPAKTYLKHQAAIERCDGWCTVLLQGRILRAAELAEAMIQIQPTPKPTAVPSKRTGALLPFKGEACKMAKHGKSPLPPGAHRIIQQCVRKLKRNYLAAFRSTPDLKRIAGRLFVAMLPPHRKQRGRPCEPHITRAAKLARRYRRARPDESAENRWNRICCAVLAGFDKMPPREQIAAKTKLKAAVRSRVNARRRRRNKSPRNVSPPKQ